MRLLIIEDEKELADGLETVLRNHGYLVDVVYDGLSGLDYILSNIYDLVLIDIMLPKLNGLDILKNIRQQKIVTPIILLTAKSEVEDKIKGLDCGADDYLTKPFDARELLARVRARTRKQEEYADNRKFFGDIYIIQETQELYCGKYSVKMGNKEYQLMEFLVLNPKRILSKDILINKIWGPLDVSEYNQLEVYISFLRKKLKYVHSNIQIRNTKNVGYSLEQGSDDNA